MIKAKGAGKKGGQDAPPPPTPSLDEEVREIWGRPLAATPINKDLPRLAGRIHVTVNENTVLSAVPSDVVEVVRAPPLADAPSELSRKLMNSVEYRMSIVLRNQPDWVKALQLPPEVVNDMNSRPAAAAAAPSRPAAQAVFAQAPGAAAPAGAAAAGAAAGAGAGAGAVKGKEGAAAREQFPVWVTKSLTRGVVDKRRATDVWSAWDGPGYLRLRAATDGSRSMVLEVKMKAEKEPCAVGSSLALLEMQDSSRYFALRRIGELDSWLGFAFHTRQEAAQFKELLTPVAPPPPPAAEQPDPLSPRETEHLRVVRPISKVVLDVARALETKDTVARFEAALKALADQRSGDLEAFMPDLWRAGGEDSRTARVFKAIHQNIIFVGIYHIKTALPDVMTRDVRTPEGWQIYVHILPDVIVITHARREQALANVPESEYFWYEWQLRMIFDVQLTDMRAARLRIVNLGFGDKTTPEKRAEYTRRFGGGNIILY